MPREYSIYTILPLYLIREEGGKFRGRTRLQKLVFLVQKRLDDAFDYDFKPAQQGPLSYKLYLRMQNMEALDLVRELEGSTPSGNQVYRYELTSEGRAFLTYAIQNGLMPPEVKKAADSVLKEYGSMPYLELLDRVHTDYREYVK